MGRKKRGYVREIPDDGLKRDYRLFAIACEGSKREKEYFQQLEGISRRVIVEYIEDEEYKTDPPSSPSHVLRRAVEYAEKANLNDEDSIWLVMDVDRWGNKALNDVHDECNKRQNWHIVLSNPCFEIWLLYHTTDNLDNINTDSGKECKQALDAQSPQGYNPKRYIVLIKDAIKNAKAADQSNGWYPERGNTKIHELVESLMNFVSIKEFEAFVNRIKTDLTNNLDGRT